jgi:hypothetical protein
MRTLLVQLKPLLMPWNRYTHICIYMYMYLYILKYTYFFIYMYASMFVQSCIISPSTAEVAANALEQAQLFDINLCKYMYFYMFINIYFCMYMQRSIHKCLWTNSPSTAEEAAKTMEHVYIYICIYKYVQSYQFIHVNIYW